MNQEPTTSDGQATQATDALFEAPTLRECAVWTEKDMNHAQEVDL